MYILSIYAAMEMTFYFILVGIFVNVSNEQAFCFEEEMR